MLANHLRQVTSTELTKDNEKCITFFYIYLPCINVDICLFKLKNSMKRHKSNKPLYQVLDARQLGLKLIANVTYGYTSANFSGRMPCIEVIITKNKISFS